MLDLILQLWRRLLFYLRRDQFDRDLAEEMKLHLELKAEENRAAGLSPPEARQAAQRQFGNQTLLQEVSASCCGSLTGKMRQSIASIRLKIAVLAAIPMANDKTATSVKPRCLRNIRRPKCKS